MPEVVWRGKPTRGYYHAPYTRKQRDPQLAEMCEGNHFEPKYVKLIGGWEKNGKWDRGLDAFESLDTGSFGIPHFHLQYFAKEIAEFIEDHRTIADYAWGHAIADMLEDELEIEFTMIYDADGDGDLDEIEVIDKWWYLWELFSDNDPDDPKFEGKPYSEIYNPKRGFDKKGSWRVETEPFLAGLYAIARHPDYARWQINELFGKPRSMLKLMGDHGWNQEFTLAALARMANSRGNGGVRKAIRKIIKKLDTDDEVKVIHCLYHKHFKQTVTDKKTGEKTKRYHKRYPKRFKRISSRFSKSPGTAPSGVSSRKLNYDARILRVDGTIPKFVGAGLLNL